MKDRIQKEVELIRRHFPDLQFRDEGRWILIPRYEIPSEFWAPGEYTLAVQFPVGYPGNGPYGFYLSPPPTLRDGRRPNNATTSAEPPLPGSWLKFSWSLPEWRASAEINSGYNMLNFLITVRSRLQEGF